MILLLLLRFPLSYFLRTRCGQSKLMEKKLDKVSRLVCLGHCNSLACSTKCNHLMSLVLLKKYPNVAHYWENVQIWCGWTMLCTDLFSALVRLPVHSLTSRGHSHGHSHSFCSILSKTRESQSEHGQPTVDPLAWLGCALTPHLIRVAERREPVSALGGTAALTCGSWGRVGPQCCRRRRPESRTSRWRCRRTRLCRGFWSDGTWSSGSRGPGWSSHPEDKYLEYLWSN